jgi:DNA-binding NtrC family response regulator
MLSASPRRSYNRVVTEAQTTEQELAFGADHHVRVPGLVLVWSAGRPTCRTFEVSSPLVLGREGNIALPDKRASRRHAEVAWVRGLWHVRDLDSSNGTFVDGEQVQSGVFEAPRVLRVGGSIILFEPDITRFDGREDLREGDYVVGPALRRVKQETLDAATFGKNLLVMGESGAGKEKVAEWYHHHGPRVRGPFVTLNCANIPPDLAEALLFGAERGAYSGAHVSKSGHLRDAHQGVLFLDEVAELALEVQAKLLRAVETRTVIPLGATAARPADVAIVSATNADVRAAIEAGKFRHDLQPRLAQREVRLPPLRARLEEIPFLLQHALAGASGSPPPSVRFVEACLAREWRLNVRELFNAVERAAAEGRRTAAPELTPAMLPEPLAHAPSAPTSVAPAPSQPAPASSAVSEAPSLNDGRRARLLAALEKNGFDVAAAATELGMPRSTFYAAMKRFGISAK